MGITYLIPKLAGKLAFRRRIKISRGLLLIPCKDHQGDGKCCCRGKSYTQSEDVIAVLIVPAKAPKLHSGTMLSSDNHSKGCNGHYQHPPGSTMIPSILVNL